MPNSRSQSLNLALRALLELAALVAVGYWGWTVTDSFARVALAIGLPVAAAAIWGIFAVPGDPSRSGNAPVPVPGVVRLILELAILGLGALAVLAAGYPLIGAAVAALIVVHYALSRDRVCWLVKQ